MIAALYVETDGVYFGLDAVDPWDEQRDAREYPGPHPVVAHPPCQRWGRFWHGSPSNPNQFKLGDDNGCFADALRAVRTYGGVLEHPADSHAWAHHGLIKPERYSGWSVADDVGGWTCHLDQTHYGAIGRKPTWLYATQVELPSLNWSRAPQQLDHNLVEKYGYEYARRKGLVSLIGGKDKTKKRNATPLAFRDVLIAMARSAAKKE